MRERLVTTVTIPTKWLTLPDLVGSKHMGFLFIFDPDAKLPLRLLEFESDFDGSALQKILI